MRPRKVRLKSKLFKQFILIFFAVIVALIVHGCAVGPDYHPPAPPHASRYTFKKLPKQTTSVAAGNAGKSQIMRFKENIPNEWWHVFHSASLDLLIQEGLKNNPNLKAAKKSLEVAQYTLRAEIGNLLVPAIDLQVGAARTRLATIQYGSTMPPPTVNIYQVQSLATYTLDIFGGNRREVEYYRAKVDFQYYEMMDTYLSLTTNIVMNAIKIASLEAQIRATKELIKTERTVLSIQKARLGYGGVSLQDVSLQETVLAQTVATLPPLEKSLAKENSALAVLTGRLTSNAPPVHISLNSLNLPKNLPVSVPSALVKQRPDILAASAMMHEMSAKIGVATANLLPKFTLSANFGWVAPQPSSLFIPLTKTWQLAAQMLQPLFHGMALINQRRAAVAEYQQYYEKYKEVVLNSFKSVADALNSIEIDAHKFKADVYAESSSKQTLDITFARYKLGGDNYIDVMTAQQKYLQNKLNRIISQASRYNDTADLYKALGGGWWSMPVLPEPRQLSMRRLKL